MKEVLGEHTEVLQLGGGIVRYLEEYGAEGHFRGKHYVFDHRLVEDPRYAKKTLAADGVQLADQEEVLSRCFVCGIPWDDVRGQRRCSSVACSMPVLVCRLCQSRGEDRRATLLCEICSTSGDATEKEQGPSLEQQEI